MDKYIFSAYVVCVFIIPKYLDIKFIKQELDVKTFVRDTFFVYLSSLFASFFNEYLLESSNVKNKTAVYTGDAGF